MILIIPFVVLLLQENSICQFIALAIFIVASLTDFVDGYIARKRNLITNFGKFMDPLADKLLVAAAMIALVEMERLPAWIVIVILGREFLVSGFRTLAADKGIVIAAGKWGKWKTATQMVMICFMIANIEVIRYFTLALMWIALSLTLISMIDYLVKNKNLMKT
jgi:CDP-diacylglycerol--glycerol-3-phosphate 3-phosphatidyltransferase